jgi:hypothetical protein
VSEFLQALCFRPLVHWGIDMIILSKKTPVALSAFPQTRKQKRLEFDFDLLELLLF